MLSPHIAPRVLLRALDFVFGRAGGRRTAMEQHPATRQAAWRPMQAGLLKRLRAALIGALALAGLACLPAVAEAEWRLQNDRSQLAFVTIKAGDLGEVHTFGELSGRVDDDGAVTVDIDLASVDTLIPIRDERMRDILFETVQFPTATLTANIGAERLRSLAGGTTGLLSVDGVLRLKGAEIQLRLEVMTERLADGAMLVASRKPAVVLAAAIGLTDGVERLREIARLPSISQAVPVSFVLVFQRD